MPLKKTLLSVVTLALLPSTQALASTPTPVTVKPGYFPLIIKNDMGDSQNIQNAYFLALGKNANTDVQCAFQFKSEKVGPKMAEIGTCIPISKSMNTQDYTYSLTKLPGYDSATHSVLLYIPEVISGRAYISLNYKLTFPIVQTPNKQYAFQSPNLNNKSDPNYNILFDKFEYTYDKTKTFWINPTSVDFFAIPITLMPYSQKGPTGAPLGTTRSDLITTMKDTIESHDESTNKVWDKIFIKDQSGKTNTILRVAAPYVAPDFPVSSYLAQPDYNYLTHLIDYYKAHTITVNCIELAGDKAANIHKFYNGSTDPQLYLFKGQVQMENNKPYFVFTNSVGNTKLTPYPAIKIDLSDTAALSKGFFMPGQAPLTTVNHTVQSVIVKNLTAAFSAGLLPAAPGATLDSAFFEAHKNDYYRANPLLQNKTGPWYDLYSKAIHSAIPITYAYAYDDVLGQDGTLNSQNNADPITVILGDMGGIQIPAPFTPIPHFLQPVTGTYNSGFKCDGDQCTLTAKWTVPKTQQAGVSYFILPQKFQNTTPTDIIKNQGNLLPENATTGTITLDKNQVEEMNPKIQVFTCVKGGSTHPCPSASNGYDYGKSDGSAFF